MCPDRHEMWPFKLTGPCRVWIQLKWLRFMNLQFPVEWQTDHHKPSLLVAETRTHWSLEATEDWIVNNTVLSSCQCLFVFWTSPPSLLPLLDCTSLSHSPSPPSITRLWSSDQVMLYFNGGLCLYCALRTRSEGTGWGQSQRSKMNEHRQVFVSARLSPWSSISVSASEQLLELFHLMNGFLVCILFLTALGVFRKSHIKVFLVLSLDSVF